MGFIGETKVYTLNGYKKIEDLKIGELVLTHKNRYKKIVNLEVISNQPITEIRTLCEKSFYTTDAQFIISSQIEETHYTDTKRKLVFDLNYEDFLVGIEHIAKYGELGCAFYVYDKVTSIANIGTFETIYNLQVEEDNTFVVNDRIFGGFQ